jgi:hypothetical protein
MRTKNEFMTDLQVCDASLPGLGISLSFIEDELKKRSSDP